MNGIIYKELGFDIIGVAMEVHRDLGSGFLEKVYENAMVILFEERQIKVEQQKHLDLIYHNKNIGKYIADILIEDKVILELKTVENITDIHVA